MKYNPDTVAALLEVYSLDEILEAAGLEKEDVVCILGDLGYLDNVDLPEPL